MRVKGGGGICTHHQCGRLDIATRLLTRLITHHFRVIWVHGLTLIMCSPRTVNQSEDDTGPPDHKIGNNQHGGHVNNHKSCGLLVAIEFAKMFVSSKLPGNP